MSKLNRRGRGCFRSESAASASESCKRDGRRHHDYLEVLLGSYPESQDVPLLPEAAAADASAPTHAEEAACHADKAEKYAQVTAEILGNFAKHFASLMDPFGVTNGSVKLNSAEKQTPEAEEKTSDTTSNTALTADNPKTAPAATLIVETTETTPTTKSPTETLYESISRATTATPSLNTSTASSSISDSSKSSRPVPDWTLVDDKGNADDENTALQSTPTGTKPKVSPTASLTATSTPLSFAKLADDLQRHMDADLAAEHAAAIAPSPRSMTTNIPEHLSKSIFEP